MKRPRAPSPRLLSVWQIEVAQDIQIFSWAKSSVFAEDVPARAWERHRALEGVNFPFQWLWMGSSTALCMMGCWSWSQPRGDPCRANTDKQAAFHLHIYSHEQSRQSVRSGRDSRRDVREKRTQLSDSKREDRRSELNSKPCCCEAAARDAHPPHPPLQMWIFQLKSVKSFRVTTSAQSLFSSFRNWGGILEENMKRTKTCRRWGLWKGLWLCSHKLRWPASHCFISSAILKKSLPSSVVGLITGFGCCLLKVCHPHIESLWSVVAVKSQLILIKTNQNTQGAAASCAEFGSNKNNYKIKHD